MWLVRSAVMMAAVLLCRADAVADRVGPSARVKSFVTVRAAPDPAAKGVGHLKQGESATFLRNTKYWRKVRLVDGRVGYVSRSWTVAAPDGPPVADSLVVTFIDVGEGDAILLQLGTLDILVDAGPALTPNLERSLEAVRGPIEQFWLTHPHKDHFGGAADLLARHQVGAIRSNGEHRGPPRDDKLPPEWSDFTAVAQAKGLPIGTFAVGDELTPVPGLTIQVLASGGRFKDTPEGEHINNDSLVLMVTFGGKRLLLTGDIEKAAAKELVKTYCGSGQRCPALHADILKVPHHGSADFDRDFLAKVGAEWAVISAGFRHAGHCLPHKSSIEALREIGMKVASTSSQDDENVTLTITKTGALSWKLPAKDVFAWDPDSGRCSTVTRSVTYRQGE